MAIDVRRIALAAVEAALDQQGPQEKQKKRRLPPARAFLVGAGLVAAGRAAMQARDRGLLDSLQERLASLAGEDDGREPEGEEEPEAAEADLEAEGGEEPEGLEDEEPEGLEDEEPEGLEDEEPYDDEDEEPYDEEDEEPYDEEDEEPYDEEDEDEPEDLEGDYDDEDWDEEEEEVERPSKRRAGTATKGRRRGSRNGRSRDGTG